MRFDYTDYFELAPSTGYETLIYDCMTGDTTLFQRADKIEAGWRIVQPLIDLWSDGKVDAPSPYPAGSQGRRRPTNCWRATGGAGAHCFGRKRHDPPAGGFAQNFRSASIRAVRET